jgi:hypothetical protein
MFSVITPFSYGDATIVRQETSSSEGTAQVGEMSGRRDPHPLCASLLCFPPNPARVGCPSALTAFRWTVCGEHAKVRPASEISTWVYIGGPSLLLVLAPGLLHVLYGCGGYHLWHPGPVYPPARNVDVLLPAP